MKCGTCGWESKGAIRCSPCHTVYMKTWRKRNREKEKEYRKQYKTSELGRLAYTRWYEKNKDKKAVHSRVHSAVKAGRITRQPCEVCGKQDSMAHHDDYTKPLDVRWLCSLHHSETHRLINEQRQAAT